MRIQRVSAAGPMRVALLAAMLAGAVPAAAQDNSAVVIPRSTAQSHGLKRAWLTHIEINPGKDKVQDVVYWGPSSPPPKQAAPKGGPLEVIGKKEPMEVEDLLPKPPPPPVVVPIEERNTLFVLSRRSVLHALDGETGRTLWVTQVGSREKPSEAPGVGKLYVAVVNGSDLYVLDRRDGGVAFRKALVGVSSAAPAVGDEWIYVPMLSGHVTAYKLPDVRLGADAPAPVAPAEPAPLAAPQPKGAPGKVKDGGDRQKKLRELQRADYEAGVIPMMTYSSFAPVNVPPLVTPQRLAWATSRGQIYLAYNHRAEIDNRFDTLRPIEAPLTYWPPYVYATSKDGYVYGIHEAKVEAPWRYSIGEPLYEPAVAIEDAVYAVGPNSGMFCLDARSGERRWWAPGIRRCLAVAATRLYAADNSGALQVLDRKSGAQVDSLRIDRLDVRVVNWRSDRMYLGTSAGVMQCLHEITQEKPLMHQFAVTEEAKKEPAKVKKEAAAEEGANGGEKGKP